tara:strand:- start:175 stop:537 length:363 start_codon:yes stop_codon:yes gene_type:complete
MIKQRGASTLGILSPVLLAIGVLLISLRVGPLYLDNMSLNQAIESSARSNNFNNLSTAEIRNALSKTFQVNAISVNPRDFDIEKTATSVELIYVHEERAKIFGDVDVVVTFTNSYSTANN